MTNAERAKDLAIKMLKDRGYVVLAFIPGMGEIPAEVGVVVESFMNLFLPDGGFRLTKECTRRDFVSMAKLADVIPPNPKGKRRYFRAVPVVWDERIYGVKK